MTRHDRADVIVLGSGIVGLTTAAVLADAGHKVEVYHSQTKRASSWAACALFLPYFGAVTDLRTETWAAISWGVFAELSRHSSATGISSIRMIEMLRAPSEPPQVLRRLSDVCLNDDPRLPTPFRHSWTFTTWLMDVRLYLPYLVKRCQQSGVEFVVAEVTEQASSLADAPFVVNCGGYWATSLFRGMPVKPVRGQSIVLRASRLQAAVGGDQFIVAPRSDGVLVGSLWLAGDADDQVRGSDTETLLSVYDSWVGSELFRSLGASRGRRIVGAVGGVRPVCESGPLVEVDPSWNNSSALIHNNGHGGAGAALSWGSANEVLQIIRSLA